MCKSKAEPLIATEAFDRTRSGSTARQASAALCKGIVGTGIFALPPAIRASGWVLGTFLALLCGVVSLLTMRYNFACIRELRRRGYADDNDGRIEYNDIFAHSQLLSVRANGLVTLLCVVGQLGSVLSFYAFVINNVLSLLPATVARWHVSAAMTLFTAPLTLLRSTSHPAFGAAMIFGNVAVAAALGVVVYGGLSVALNAHARADHGELVAFDGGGLGLMFGVSLLMFSAHMEAVSIEQDMARRDQFDRVLTTTFGCVVLLFLGFGLLVYACFGEATGRVALTPTPTPTPTLTRTRTPSPTRTPTPTQAQDDIGRVGGGDHPAEPRPAPDRERGQARHVRQPHVHDAHNHAARLQGGGGRAAAERHALALACQRRAPRAHLQLCRGRDAAARLRGLPPPPPDFEVSLTLALTPNLTLTLTPHPNPHPNPDPSPQTSPEPEP
jgi:hypothetical protein